MYANVPGLLFVAASVCPPPIESPAIARSSLAACTRKRFSTNGITSLTRLSGYEPAYSCGAPPHPPPAPPRPAPAFAAAACTGGGAGACTDCLAGVGPEPYPCDTGWVALAVGITTIIGLA